MNWKEEIPRCTRCSLHLSRTHVVIGEGPEDARVMLVGEAPGRNEDLQGRPFVGAAGKFLNELLAEAGLRREEVYITNVVKCRPPGNRDPRKEEIEACSIYLEAQLSDIAPEFVITLGRHAFSWFNERFSFTSGSLSSNAGRAFKVSTLWGPLTVIVSYHPAAALYNPSLKEVMKEHFREFRKILRGNKDQ